LNDVACVARRLPDSQHRDREDERQCANESLISG
jgi:hypothetical protein